MRILLADDDFNFSYVLKKELEEHSFTVDIVANGVDVILNIIRKDYDFILLDIKMPRLNGMDTLKIIEALRTSRVINDNVQVLTFSGENGKLQSESIAHGAIKYIRKPFNIEALTQFILGLSVLHD